MLQPMWALTSSMALLHPTLSIANSLQFLIPNLLKSARTQFHHLFLGFPLNIAPSGLLLKTIFTFLLFSILMMCPNHLSIWYLMWVFECSSLYNSYNSSLYLALHPSSVSIAPKVLLRIFLSYIANCLHMFLFRTHVSDPYVIMRVINVLYILILTSEYYFIFNYWLQWIVCPISQIYSSLYLILYVGTVVICCQYWFKINKFFHLWNLYMPILTSFLWLFCFFFVIDINLDFLVFILNPIFWFSLFSANFFRGHLGFLTVKFLQGGFCQPHAQPPTWRTRSFDFGVSAP